MKKPARADWDLTALLNGADPRLAPVERHLWLIRLLQWLRHAPLAGEGRSTPTPVLRLKHLLGVLERNPEHGKRVSTLLARFLIEVDSTALLADYGFAPRMDLWGEFARRLRARLLPRSPDGNDLGQLFDLLFEGADARWLAEIDDATLQRLGALIAPGLAGGRHWHTPFLDAIAYLSIAVRSAAFSPALRPRMDARLTADAPFRQLGRVAEALCEAVQAGDAPAALQQAQYLRALLDSCRRAAESVHGHLEAHGVSVDVVFEVDQLVRRTWRIEALMTCVISPEPGPELRHLVAELAGLTRSNASIRALFARHYSLLARKVAERSAETGEHYITRNSADYQAMLRAAAGGGAVIAGTTFAKFAIGALGLSIFWGGFWAGINYAASFVIVMLLHWTVATKQPAMTAPAMADKLLDVGREGAVEEFVDEVAHLIRSQAAGIFGNLAMVIPLVLLGQWLATLAFGAPLVGTKDAEYVLDGITLLGPTALYAAFTGVLLFASSLIAGWAENWFVWHRLHSAIAWNPRSIAWLGAPRAARWAGWWRANISGLAGNISLGMMLGLVPALALFFGLPIEVRHVTLSTGQLAAAAGALGFGLLEQPAFWWCVAGIAATGVLNLGVSFFLAFRVALRSRGIRLADRSRIHRAIRQRLRREPLSFLLPPRAAASAV